MFLFSFTWFNSILVYAIGWLVGGSLVRHFSLLMWLCDTVKPYVLPVMDCVTARCGSQDQPTKMTLARQRVLSSSEVRASDLEHGGSWVRIPSGAQIFSVSSYGWFFTSPFNSSLHVAWLLILVFVLCYFREILEHFTLQMSAWCGMQTWMTHLMSVFLIYKWWDKQSYVQALIFDLFSTSCSLSVCYSHNCNELNETKMLLAKIITTVYSIWSILVWTFLGQPKKNSQKDYSGSFHKWPPLKFKKGVRN